MFTLCLQWHCSAFTGQWVVPALPHQCLCLLICLWPLHILPLSLHSSLLQGCSPGYHRVLHFCPHSSFSFSCIMWPVLITKGKLLCFFLEKTPPLFMFKILEILPLLGATLSFFGWCEVSPSPFLAAHQLPSVAGPCEVTTSKTSWMTPVSPFQLRLFHDLWSSPLRKSTAGTAGHADFMLPNCFSLKDFSAKFPSSLILSFISKPYFKAVRRKLLTQSWPSSASVRH